MKMPLSVAFTRKKSLALSTSLSHSAQSFAGIAHLLVLAATLPWVASHAHAQAVWSAADDRNNYEGAGIYRDFWSYGYVAPDRNGNNGHAGNWSGSLAPGQGGPADALIGAPGGTLCDVRATLSSLTLAPGGNLDMDFSSSLSVATTNINTTGTLGIGIGGGAFPAYTNTGTLTVAAGTGGTFTIAGDLTLNSTPGSTIAVTSGTLQLPGQSGLFDTVTFNPAAGTTINLVGQGATGTFVNIFQGTLTNGAGTGTVLLSQGSMAGTQRYLDASLITPCTLAFTGSVFQWTGGNIGNYQQGAIFTNTGVVNISGDMTKETYAAFTNNGRVVQSGAGQFNVGNYNSGGSFTNAAAATYDLQSDASIGQSGYAFNNVGLFKKSGGTGTSTLSVSFNNQNGTVEVDSGTLQMPVNVGNSTSTGGTFNVAAGAVLDLGDGGHFTGTYTGSGGGTVQISQGSLYSDKTTGANFNFPGAMLQWTGGTIGGYQGGQSFTNAGTLTLSGTGDKTSYTVFTNSGTMIQTGTGNFNAGYYNSGGSFTNAATGTYDLQSDAAIGQSGYPFINKGFFQKSSGTGTSKMTSTLTNTGTISVYSGTLEFADRVNDMDGTKLTEGTWNVYNGATLTFDGYTVKTNQADVFLRGPNSMFPAFDSLSDNQGTFSLLALRQFTTAGDLSNEGDLSLDAGTTLHVAGAFTASGDNASLAITLGGTATSGATSPGVLQVSGAAALGGDLTLTFARNAGLPGSGDTLTILAAGSPVTGSFANAASGSRLSTIDGSGSFRVTYGAGTNTVVLSDFLRPGQADMPTATLSALVPSAVANSGQDAEFLLTLSSAPTSDVVVNFTIKGTAINGTDFVLLKASKKIKAGKTSKPIKIVPVGDLGGVSKKTVVLTLLPGEGYTVGTSGKVKVKVLAP